MTVAIEDIVPSALDATDRALVRRGAGPLDHTMELIQLAAIAESGSASDLTGTKAEFDAAVTDGNFLFSGDVTQYTDEKAQDAVGAMVDASLIYVDATPLLQRAALTGAVTAAAGSNATALGNFTKAQLTAAVSDGDPLYVGDIGAVVTAAPASDQSDWSPSGFASSTSLIKAQPTTNSFITGLVAGSTDQEIMLFNDSAFVICLECESTASTAANRFAKIPDVPWILPGQSVELIYNATLSRWMITDQSFPIVYGSKASQLITPATGTSINVVGLGSQLSTATISTVAPSGTPTNDFLEYGYTQGTNSTAAGTTSIRSGQAMHMRGASANRQGFVYYGRVQFSALGAVSGAVRAGMMSTTAVSTTLNAALTQCLLLGADTVMTTLRIFRGDAAAGTPIDLGANFPVPSATAAYDVLFYAPPNASYVRYMVRRLDTRFVAEGSLTTNIPGNTQVLSQRVEAMVGATAVANTWRAAFSLVVGL